MTFPMSVFCRCTCAEKSVFVCHIGQLQPSTYSTPAQIHTAETETGAEVELIVPAMLQESRSRSPTLLIDREPVSHSAQHPVENAVKFAQETYQQRAPYHARSRMYTHLPNNCCIQPFANAQDVLNDHKFGRHACTNVSNMLHSGHMQYRCSNEELSTSACNCIAHAR